MSVYLAPASLRAFPSYTGVATKICGLRQPEHALSALHAGADMLGMVFAPSKRQITVEQAREIAVCVERDASPSPMLVGVFVNELPERMFAVARAVGLNVLQLSGDESADVVAECALHYPLIKALRFSEETTPETALMQLESYISLNLGGRLRLLVDAYRPGEYGGTGEVAAWSLSAELARYTPLILAGGLHSGNVAEAICTVQPWGVDVSSGVEHNGVKSPQLIESFVQHARAHNI